MLIKILYEHVGNWNLKSTSKCLFFKWANPALSLFYCCRSFQQQLEEKDCRLQRDSNSDHRSRSREHWPLDNHRGLKYFKVLHGPYLVGCFQRHLRIWTTHWSELSCFSTFRYLEMVLVTQTQHTIGRRGVFLFALCLLCLWVVEWDHFWWTVRELNLQPSKAGWANKLSIYQ